MENYNTNSERVVIRDWAKGNLFNVIKNLKTKKQINFIFEEDSYTDISILTELLCALKKHNIKPQNCNFMIEVPQKNFLYKDMTDFDKMNTELKKHGSFLLFKETTMVFTYPEVKNANLNIKLAVQKIKNANLSTFEQLVMAYKIVTSREYLEEPKTENFLISRSLCGVFNSKYIVCVGYSRWLSEIIAGLDNKDLKCEILPSVIYSPNGEKKSGHSSNVIYINSKELKGLYYADPCLSSVSYKGDAPSLSYFMLPIDDLKLCKTKIFVPEQNSPFYYFFTNEDINPILADYSIEQINTFFKKHNQFDIDTERRKYKNALLDKATESIISINNKINEIELNLFENISYKETITEQQEEKLIDIIEKRLTHRIDKTTFDKQSNELIDEIKSNSKTTQNKTILEVLSNYKEKQVDKRQQAYKDLDESLKIKNDRFVGQKMELHFLEEFSSNIKDNSKPLSVEDLKTAYKNVLRAENVTDENINKIVEEVISKSISSIKENFEIEFCSSKLATEAQKRQDLYSTQAIKFKEKALLLRQKREEKKKQKLLEEEKNKTLSDEDISR